MSIKCYAAMLGLWVALDVQASDAIEQLGALFTSPEQRQALDNLRNQYHRGAYKTEGKAQYKFNGVISRGGKAQTVWIDGVRDKRQRPVAGAQGQYRIVFPAGRKQLKPGQVYHPENGAVSDVFD